MASSREVIKLIKADGWYRVKSNGGSYQQFKHPTKKYLPQPTIDSIMRQTGLNA